MFELFSPETIAVTAILLGFTIFSFKKDLLTSKGVIIADILGILIYYFGGFYPFIGLAIFYVVAETATKIAKSRGHEHEQRTSSNVLGNAGAALIALALGFPIGYFGAMAAALADTISSEIGLLSKKKPVLITTFKEVEHGTDGGVTLLGLAASLFGAALIGVFYYYTVNESTSVAAAIIFGGFIASLVDSFLGAMLQRRNLIDNTQVNFLASTSGAVMAVAIGGFI